MSSQIKAGAVLSYVIISVNIVLGVLYTPFMLRMLGQSEYGLYSLGASVIAYLTILDLGFGNAIVRYTALFRKEGRQKEQYEMFGMFSLLYIAIGVVALALGLAIAFNVDKIFGATLIGEEMETMRTILMLMSFNLAFTFPLSIFGSIISAYENFVFQKVVNIIRIILNPLVMIILLMLGYKAVAMVIVTTIFNLTTLLINCIYCFRKLKIKIVFARFRWGFLKEVSIYSFWILLNVIMDRIYGNTGQFILGIYRSTNEVAVYSASIQLKDMYYLFSTAITGVFLPKITAMVAAGADDKDLSDIFIRTGRLQFIVMAFILSGFALLGRAFIGIWAGEGYEQAYIITLLLFISSLIPLIQNLGITILQAKSQLRFRSLLYLFISIGCVAVSIPMAQRFGGIGCAIATSAALLLGQGLIMNIYYSRRVGIDIPRFWREIIRMAIVPTLVSSIGWLLLRNVVIDSISKFLLCGSIFAVIYLPLFWIFSMNNYEKELISRPLKKLIGYDRN